MEAVEAIQFNCCANNDSETVPSIIDGPGIDAVVSVVVPILFGFISVAGFIGNTIVLVVVGMYRQKNITNILMLNLAVADLLFVLFCIPCSAVIYATGVWTFGSFLCKTGNYLIVVNLYESVSTLLLMTGMRFLAIVFPLKSKPYRTKRITLTALGISWAVVLVWCIPTFLLHDAFSTSYGDQCEYFAEYENVYGIVFFITSYAIPLCIIIGLSVGILLKLRIAGPISSSADAQQLKRNQGSRIIVAVVCTFAVCWLPLQIVLLLTAVGVYKFTVGLQIAAQSLGYVNACVNPVLYAFLSENFRKSIVKCW